VILQRIDVILRNGCSVTESMWYYGIKVILKDQCDIIGSMWYYNVIYAITESVCYCIIDLKLQIIVPKTEVEQLNSYEE